MAPTRLSLILGVALVITISCVALVVITHNSVAKSVDEASVEVTFATHSPICIDGNVEFTSANGVIGGSGTSSDPYIIADWNISASAENGIWINGTDVHFTIRNCLVQDGYSSFHPGIYVSNCINGVIEDNDCSNDAIGIRISFSNYIAVRNNTCLNDMSGIYLDSAYYCTLSGNNCSNGNHGIVSYSSSYNTVSNNSCIRNFFGMYLHQSTGNSVTYNNISASDLDGIALVWTSNSNEIHENMMCNDFGYCVNISSGSNNRIWNNTFIDNNGAGNTYQPSHVQANDNGTDNWWNATDGSGNYWSDWTAPDANYDGIVDNPYDIDGGAVTRDYYPRSLTPPDRTPPVISITGPTAGSKIRGAYVDITWQSSDNVRVAATEMKVDNTDWSQVSGTEVKHWRFESGDHTIQIRVTDAAGNQAVSSVSFNTNNRAFSFGGPYYGIPLVALIAGIIAAALVGYVLVTRRAPSSP